MIEPAMPLAAPGLLSHHAVALPFAPLIRPSLAELYARRAARLRAQAEGHDLAEYLRLAARVAEAQAMLLPEAVGLAGPMDVQHIARQAHWLPLLDRLIERLAPDAAAPVAPHLAALRALSAPQRIAAAQALAAGRFSAVPTAIAPFLWAAFSLQCASVAQTAPHSGGMTEDAFCPVCGTAPVASLILTGDRQGMRYLHCALCESAWHMVRAKCTNCGDASDLDYLSLDTTEALVRAESCGACHGYLKVISLERDPRAEAVADDLATLSLDDAVTAAGYRRTGFNPFALPQ